MEECGAGEAEQEGEQVGESLIGQLHLSSKFNKKSISYLRQLSHINAQKDQAFRLLHHEI